MSNEKENELEELRKQIEAETGKAPAATAVVEPPAPSPEPSPVPAPEPAPETPAPVAPNPSNPALQGEDDPMEWARKKGLKSPEDMARELLKKEKEFHQSRQQPRQPEQTVPVPPQNWQPRPEMGYQAPFQPIPDFNRQIAERYQMDPEDVRRFMPMVADVAEAVASRRTVGLEREIIGLQRANARQQELMSLLQDPAFVDSRVQKEVHSILESDPGIFHREPQPFVHAYEKAMVNLARKQLQHGVGAEHQVHNKPPVTAGGGNGSAFTIPQKVTEKDFDSWSLEEQKAFIDSNGRKVPKR